MPGNPSDSFPGPIKRVSSILKKFEIKINNSIFNFQFPGLVDPNDQVDPSKDVPFVDYDTGSRDVKGEPSLEDSDDVLNDEETTTIEPSTNIVKRDVPNLLITRENVYRLLEGRLNAYGMDGKKCLLLAICESSRLPFLEHNGILGNILHVILT